MPFINVKISKGATRDQKKELVRRMTNDLVEVLGKDPNNIHMVIEDVEWDNWGFKGELLSDVRKQSD